MSKYTGYDCVIAIDPGAEHTGLFYNTIVDGKLGYKPWGDTINKCNATFDEYKNSILYLFKNNTFGKTLIVIENFRLQQGKSSAQTNQEMRTSELIGFIEGHCISNKLHYVRQENTIKSRWSDVLCKEELHRITPPHTSTLDIQLIWKSMDRHEKDAARHFLHAFFFTQYKKDKIKKP